MRLATSSRTAASRVRGCRWCSIRSDDGRWSASASFARYVSSLNTGMSDVSAGGNPATYQWPYQGPAINPSPSGPFVDDAPGDSAGVRLVLRQWRHQPAVQPGRYSRRFDRFIGDSLDSPNVNEWAVGLARQLPTRIDPRGFRLSQLRGLLCYAHRHDDRASGRQTRQRVRSQPGREHRCRQSRLQGRHDSRRITGPASHVEVGGNYTISKTAGDIRRRGLGQRSA